MTPETSSISGLPAGDALAGGGLAAGERQEGADPALGREIVETLREMEAAAERARDLQAETRRLEAALGGIRASNSWRALEFLRRNRFRARRLGRGVAARLWRRRGAGVPEAVRRAPIGVNIAGYIGAESGLGEAVRSSIRTVERAGFPYVLNDVRGVQRASDTTYTAFAAANPHPFNLVHLNADNMVIFEDQRGRGYFRHRYTIGFWFWELSRFRDDWADAFRVVDEVWVATRFARDAIRAASPVPVLRMPLPVAAPPPSPLGRPHFGIPAGRFTFLFTFDASSQAERKNPMAVVRAFRKAAFAPKRAMLVLKFTNGQADRAAVRALAEAADGADVLLLDGCMDRGELGALMRACDCFVSLHRSEGFGLAMAEAMALGKPVIATAYSGNVDFMTRDTACLIGYRLVPLDRFHGPYPRGFEWAEPDVDEAARAMRRMVEAPAWAGDLGRRASEAVAGVLGLDAAAERYRGRLEAIRSGVARPGDEGGAGA